MCIILRTLKVIVSHNTKALHDAFYTVRISHESTSTRNHHFQEPGRYLRHRHAAVLLFITHEARKRRRTNSRASAWRNPVFVTKLSSLWFTHNYINLRTRPIMHDLLWGIMTNGGVAASRAAMLSRFGARVRRSKWQRRARVSLGTTDSRGLPASLSHLWSWLGCLCCVVGV